MRRRVLLVAIVLAVACESSTAPTDVARIDVATETALKGTVGARVTPAPAVRAVDEAGRPVAGVAVSFEAGGGGTITSTTVQTGKDGLATVGNWILGPTAGNQTVTARVAGLVDVVFNATAEAGPAARILPVSGNNQTGGYSQALLQPLLVRVTDSFHNPISGATVTFLVIAGQGSIQPDVAVTSIDGNAASGLWTLGPAAGVQQVRAISGSAQAVFSAQAVGLGSVTGVVHGSGTGYPWGPWAMGYPEYPSVWPIGIVAVPEATGQRPRSSSRGNGGSFRFDNLTEGLWTIQFRGMHPFPGVFPQMRLYADTAISVTVLANRTIDLQDIFPQPVDPFISVAIDHCPWGLAGPPTLNDWGQCDSGYWGAPVDIQVDVRGIEGTPTSGKHYSFSIPAGQISYELRDAVPGDYVVSVAPAAASVVWRLVPWQSSSTRLRLERGIGYALFSFWYLTS